jgi:hypothetical protein
MGGLVHCRYYVFEEIVSPWEFDIMIKFKNRKARGIIDSLCTRFRIMGI